MRILHIIESSGGSADFVLSLIQYIPNYQHTVIYGDRTFEGRFLVTKEKFPTAKFIHWKFAQREIRLWADIQALIYLYGLLKRTPCDVIHLHSSKAGFLGRFVCFLLNKKRVIYTPNGLAFLRKDVPACKKNMYAFLEKFSNCLNGKVISCSKSEAQALIEIGVQGRFINNGTKIFENPLKTLDKNAPLTIVTTGRVTDQKNPSLFNKIAKHFEFNLDYRFVWIGAGELEHELTASNITITGWLDKASVIKIVKEADVYISTALWEGLPFAVIEAMNMNKPMLLTNCVGNIDLVKNGENGFTFNIAQEAIARIITFNEKREIIVEMGIHSHQLVKNEYDVLQMGKHYEIEYFKLI